MVNETMRILKNCSEYLKWQEIASHITYFVRRLQFSGYSQEFRYNVVSKALKNYEEVRKKQSKITSNTDEEVEIASTRSGRKKKEEMVYERWQVCKCSVYTTNERIQNEKWDTEVRR